MGIESDVCAGKKKSIILCFVLAPVNGFCEILVTFKFLLQFYFVVSFFHRENHFAVLVASVPQVVLLVVQHALLTSFLKLMMSFPFVFVSFKITSHAIFRWFNCFDRFSRRCRSLSKVGLDVTCDLNSLNPSVHHFHIDHNAPCLPPPKILHNPICFQFLLGFAVIIHVGLVTKIYPEILQKMSINPNLSHFF